MTISREPVNYHHDYYFTFQQRKSRDKVHRNTFKNQVENGQRLQEAHWLEGIIFHLLAYLTFGNQLMNILMHTFPVEIRR